MRRLYCRSPVSWLPCVRGPSDPVVVAGFSLAGVVGCSCSPLPKRCFAWWWTALQRQQTSLAHASFCSATNHIAEVWSVPALAEAMGAGGPQGP